jgi:ABC-type multidrug transport system permease subunit
MPDAWVSDVAVRVNRLVERVRGTLFPPVIALESRSPGAAPGVAAGAAADDAALDAGEKADAAEPEPGFALLFAPGLLFMSLLFMSSGIAEDLWEEREARTLRRAVVAPRRAAALLAGKMLAGSGLMALVSALALAVAWSWLGLRWHRYPAAVVWSACSGTILLLLFATLQLHLPTRRGASVLASALVFPLMMLGGSFFPFEAMPDWMAALGRWTPNGWALVRLKEILVGRAEPRALLASAAALAGVGAVLFALAARRLGAAFARA